MNLSTRQLRALIQLAQDRSFTRAAEKLFMTQAGLSAIVRQIESDVGFRMFDRTTRSVALTRAGEQFLPVVHRSLIELDQAARSIRQMEQVATSTLRVAATQLVAATLIPAARASLRKKRPDINVTVVDVERPEVQRLVESGDVDVGFGLFFREASGLERTPLVTLELVSLRSALPRSKAKATPRTSTWTSMRDETLIGLNPDSDVQILVDSHLTKAGRNRSMSGAYRNFHTLVTMAEAGFGTAIVPSYILPLAGRYKLHVSPMASPRVPLDFFQVNRRGRERAAAEAEFVSHLTAVLKDQCGATRSTGQ
ncbi:MAG: LysR family transcriptional regulator [Pseudomonadota bacterium]